MSQATAFVNDEALDGGLDWIVSNGNNVHIVNNTLGGVPNTASEVTTNSLGSKDGITVGSPTDGDSSGRKVTIPSISDGSVDTTATAGYWALVNTAEDTIVAANALASTQSVTSGNTFTLGEIDITIPDPTS
jgi:hypothetical protein